MTGPRGAPPDIAHTGHDSSNDVGVRKTPSDATRTDEAPLPRVVSLLPAATEIVAALGAARALVGVTHECDHPAYAVAGIPRVTRSAIAHGSAGEVDASVRAATARGEPLFTLDDALISTLRPGVLFTQALCDVCAVSEHDVRAIAARLTPTPHVVTLGGTTIDGVLDDVTRVADALGLADEGAELVAGLRVRMRRVHARLARAAAPRPRVAMIEWTDPVYVAGHWAPEMIRCAGGVDVLGTAGAHSTTRTPAEVAESRPDVLVFAPCGYDASRAATETTAVLARPEWAWVSRTQTPVWAIDANSLTSRPGPRIVDGVEALAAMFHPSLFPAPAPAIGCPVSIVV